MAKAAGVMPLMGLQNYSKLLLNDFINRFKEKRVYQNLK